MTEENAAPDANAKAKAKRLKSTLESLLFVADEPLRVETLLTFFNSSAYGVEGKVERTEIESALKEIELDYERGSIELAQIADGWRFQTRAEHADSIREFFIMERGKRLGRAALEALAIVAYRQPITRAQVDDIRGVDSGAALRSLIEKRLLKTLGRAKRPGRPILYGTTRRFLEHFGLARLTDLPTVEELSAELNLQGKLDFANEPETIEPEGLVDDGDEGETSHPAEGDEPNGDDWDGRLDSLGADSCGGEPPESAPDER